MKNIRYPHLFERLYGRPLLLHPDKAFVIESVFRAQLKQPFPVIGAFQSDQTGDIAIAVDENSVDETQIESGIAVLPIIGTLVQRSSWLDSSSGLVSYSEISQMFADLEANSSVSGILLELDSCGGEANGVFDLADQIAAASKPVWAVVNETAFSAGYLLASAADRIILPRTAGVGSVGVIAMHVDESSKDKSEGYTYTPVFAGAKKNDFSSHEPISPSAKADLQAEVDRLYSLFVETVANNRALDAAVVIATEAGCMNPDQAIALGFADDVGTLDEALEAFAAELSSSAGNGGDSTGGEIQTRPYAARRAAARNDSRGGWFETRLHTIPAAIAAQPEEPVMQQTQPRAAGAASAANDHPTAEAHAEGHAAGEKVGHAAGLSAGASAERARISAICTSPEAEGREQLAQTLAFETEMSAESAHKVLAKSPKAAPAPAAKANPFAAAMGQIPNPRITPDGGDEKGAGGEMEEAEALIQRINNAGKLPKTAA